MRKHFVWEPEVQQSVKVGNKNQGVLNLYVY